MSKLITLSAISLASIFLLAQGYYYNPYSKGLIPGGHHTGGYHGIWEFLVFIIILIIVAGIFDFNGIGGRGGGGGGGGGRSRGKSSFDCGDDGYC